MNKSRVITLLCKCMDHESKTTCPLRRKYWALRYTHFRMLAVRIGWID